MIENDETDSAPKREPALVAVPGSPLKVGRDVLCHMLQRRSGRPMSAGGDASRRSGPPSRKLMADEVKRFFPGIAAKAG